MSAHDRAYGLRQEAAEAANEKLNAARAELTAAQQALDVRSEVQQAAPLPVKAAPAVLRLVRNAQAEAAVAATAAVGTSAAATAATEPAALQVKALPLQAKAVPAAQAKVVPPPMASWAPPPKTLEYGYKPKPAAPAASGYKAPPLAVLLKDAGMPMPVKSLPPGFTQPLPAKSPPAGFSEEDMAQPAAAGGQWLTNHYGDGATTWATIDDLRTLGVPAAPPLSPCPADQGVLPPGPPSAAAADAPQVRRFFLLFASVLVLQWEEHLKLS